MATTNGIVLKASNVPEFNPSVETWNIWSEKLEIHFSEIECTDDNVKKAILLKSIGAEPYSLLHNLCAPALPVSKTFKDICGILSTHYTPPTIIFNERKIFHQTKKNADESISKWYARVKKLALNCKFGSHLDAFVLDKFIMGLPEKIFERLCEEDENLTIDVALRKALIMESKFTPKISETEQSGINYVKRGANKRNQGGNNYGKSSGSNGGGNSSNGSKGVVKEKNNNSKTSRKPCSHCGWRNHDAQQCKFKNSKCHACGKTGHLASICHSKSNKTINYLSDSDESTETSFNDHFNFSVYSISGETPCDVYKLPVKIDGVEMDVTCDTGAPCTLVPLALFKKWYGKKALRPCQIPYVNYSGDKIEVAGEYDATIIYEGIEKKVVVVVTNTKNPPLLGRTFLRTFNFQLRQVNSVNSIGIEQNFSVITDTIKSEFSELFSDGLGLYKPSKITLSISENAKPIFCKPRPVPLAWKDKVEKQLRDLIAKDVLEPVDNSEWGTPLVPILKPNGELRICGDYKVTINKFLIDYKYPLPRIDEIFAALQGGKLFTKLDLSNAYNQLELDRESQLLCTWSTHIGTLKMKRMPFGIKPAAAIFQKTMENLLREIPGVVVYQDDITVTGKNLQQHVANLKLVLSKLVSAGLKVNLSKCEFFQKQINYLGFTIDEQGLKKNEERISSVLNAPTPCNISEVRGFLGMVNYYSKFIPNYASKMSPLYELLQKNTKFVWSRKCQEAYINIKKDITSDQLLAHFNPSLPIILTTDASNNAVAGVLSHKFPNNENKPVAFVSRALSKSERNYSTLEKEALAIIFCVTKLRQYLLGTNFILRTDHKPLLAIFGDKGLPVMAAARMQRWAFILSGFSYSIEYVKGSSNTADSLSRMPQLEYNKNPKENSFINFIEAENCLNFDYKMIAKETRRDAVLSKLCAAILDGTVKALKADEFRPFLSKSLELTVEYGCILWGYRTVVPQKLRNRILIELHRSHLGIGKTKALARSYVWWPKIDENIETMIKNCVPCQEVQPSPESSALIPWKPTDSVWSRIHVDFAGPIKNLYLLIIIDSHSKWVEIFLTKEITSNFTINKLRETFCRYGLVDTLVSDNGRQFTSHDFKNFMKMNNIKHIFTAPGHPATNGQAENFVKTVKKSIYAHLKDNNNSNLEIIINRFLSDYRNTKHCSTGETPSKLFFNRTLKTRFNLLRPPSTKENIIKNQQANVQNHHGKRNVEFEKGQKVLIRDYRDPNKQNWMQATIKNQLGPRSYCCIMAHSKAETKRHLNQIREFSCDEQSEPELHEAAVEVGENASKHSSHSKGGGSEHHMDPPVIDVTSSNSAEKNIDRELRPRKDGKVVKSHTSDLSE